MERVILHCDLNNFFASVECLSHPEYRNIPMAVCGSKEERHGIVLAKNEPAKRYGVKTAETIWQAKQKCPELLVAPPHMEQYFHFSRLAREIYSRYTDLIEPFGIDECWLDVTESRLLFGGGEQIAETLRKSIRQELGLTISVGVSFNKIFAKLGSDLKKPDAVTVLSQENYRERVWPLPTGELFGVGRATENTLQKYGIRTIGEIAKADPLFLRRVLGKCGELLWRSANGREGLRVARQDAEPEVKSISSETTCPSDLQTEEEVWPVLYRLAEVVSKRLREHSMLACGVQIIVKDNALQVEETQAFLTEATHRPKELADLAMRLFHRSYGWKKPVRMLGVRAIHLLEEGDAIQFSLLTDPKKEESLEKLENQIFELRSRFGEQSVSRAILLDGPEARKKSLPESK